MQLKELYAKGANWQISDGFTDTFSYELQIWRSEMFWKGATNLQLLCFEELQLDQG